MLTVLLLSGALASLTPAAQPPDYTARGLCELWAGAQCQLAACGENAKERCTSESKRCRQLSRATVSKEQASRTVECAKATLKLRCGEPPPAECQGLQGP
jgi:hypothetical protein